MCTDWCNASRFDAVRDGHVWHGLLLGRRFSVRGDARRFADEGRLLRWPDPESGVPGSVSLRWVHTCWSILNEIFDRFACSSGDHTEVIAIDFDPTVVSYNELLALFWNNHEYGLTTRIKRQVKIREREIRGGIVCWCVVAQNRRNLKPPSSLFIILCPVRFADSDAQQ